MRNERTEKWDLERGFDGKAQQKGTFAPKWRM